MLGTRDDGARRAGCLVLGVGNQLCRDEGAGLHVLRALRRGLDGRAAGIAFVDGGTLGLRLLDVVEDATHLLVLDAVDAGRRPGAVIETTPEALATSHGPTLSLHQAALVDVVALAEARGTWPSETALVGIQPGSVEVGLALTPSVAQAVPTAVAAASRVLARWGWAGPDRNR
jgi:hydrogenase maturation protease